MEPLTVQIRRDEDPIESWDDDGDLQCTDDVQFCAASAATSVTNSSFRRSGHRDSISSRRSARSDLDSIPGEDEDYQVFLHENDDVVAKDAISSARNAGIPIPENVPKSALTGGTIKRLGRKERADFIDDWSEEVQFPGPENVLQPRIPPEEAFPESLPRISSAESSPVKTSASPFLESNISPPLRPSPATLDRFRDEEDDSYVCDVPTIKVANHGVSSEKTALPSHSPSQPADREIESFDNDFELPTGDLPLRLGSHKDALETSPPVADDFDLEFSEGSIGVRFGGTPRDRRSNPSSSVSVFSPSVSSCITGESEDDGLDGLVIPEGPLDLEASLRKQQDSSSTPGPDSNDSSGGQEPAEKDDFFSDLES